MSAHADDSHHAEDKLVEVPQYSLIKFRNMFKANWPKHITAYYLIENYMEWLEKVNNIKNLKIYSLNGDWRKDGTFVIIVSPATWHDMCAALAQLFALAVSFPGSIPFVYVHT
jgi:hypothetical protein